MSGELGDGTAGPLDLRRGRGRERVRGHPQGHVDLARTEHLDQLTLAGRLAELFPEGGDVTPETLVAKGAARKGELIKVLGSGEVSVALRVTAHAFSASAAAKIEQAGGSITELS